MKKRIYKPKQDNIIKLQIALTKLKDGRQQNK